uniref:Cerebellin 10 n=1 Tax=Sander lucioperca TaxID=283035 RepID=A0A8D0CVP0_SANLU
MKISLSFMLFLLLGAVSPSESTDYQKSFPQDIYAALREMTASLVQLKADMRFLQTTGTVMIFRQVAFSASLLAGGESVVGPSSSKITLIYKHVITNIGNAYNSTTGMFTAPVRGVYHFEWTVAANGDNSHASGAGLVKNSEHVFLAYEYQATGFMSSSKAVALLLEVGDVVFVRMFVNSVVFDNGNHHTTFSGHLLFPM